MVKGSIRMSGDPTSPTAIQSTLLRPSQHRPQTPDILMLPKFDRGEFIGVVVSEA